MLLRKNRFEVALKELEETKYWLILCKESKTYPFDIQLENEINQLGLIMYKIVSTSKKNIKKE